MQLSLSPFIYLIIFLIIAVIIVVWLLKGTDDTRRTRIIESIANSRGGADEPAMRAVWELEHIAEPTPEDMFLRGRLLDYNFLRNDDTQELPAFMVNQVADLYAGAVIGLQNRNLDDNFGLNIRAPIILDNAEDFAQMFGVGDLLTAIEQAAPAVTEARREEALAEADTPIEAAETFFEASVNHTNDPQNVHDTAVIQDMKATFNKIQTGMGIMESLAEIETYARRHINDKAKAQFVVNAVVNARKGERIVAYNATEDVVLASVWQRIKHPSNHIRHQQMIDNLMIALEESGRPGVCINGRTTRYLGALVLNDFDPEVGNALTTEDYKNEIYMKSNKMLKDAIARAEQSPDEGIAAIAEYYNGNIDEVDEHKLREFKDQLKHDIDGMINEYVDRLNPGHIERLKNECFVGIDF
ncbi:hypothetical protein F-S17_0423 [Faustovirus]|nr:hypothetical protein F-LCD7_0426 [Faustovirus]QJX72194.1 hypothetical protein F-M6_0431 [Faustovirus]QJX72689.1 hypothetical protein F-S17_0423 [Faustovirus]QJX73185.1 hypothetical protein F-VV57_0424 [Faustovirus]QJX73692.1 hypothetical protein F-VV63_0426 [Faustovirus]